MEILSVGFCEQCAREQEIYFSIGEQGLLQSVVEGVVGVGGDRYPLLVCRIALHLPHDVDQVIPCVIRGQE